jgi:hypothetical protein
MMNTHALFKNRSTNFLLRFLLRVLGLAVVGTR